VFRRRSGEAPAVLESDQPHQVPESPARQAGKGRPTPKRSEVERRRREPYTPPPADRKAAATQRRERQRTERLRRTEAMRKGEEWAIPPKDRGQVRALARDYVDSRKVIVSEYVLFGVFAVVIAVFALGQAKNSSVILFIEIGIVCLIALESMYHAAVVGRLARKRFPGQSTRGLSWYIAKRAIKLRSTRIPPARVTRGQAI
jgi:Protein of unknown function (DUF3043)